MKNRARQSSFCQLAKLLRVKALFQRHRLLPRNFIQTAPGLALAGRQVFAIRGATTTRQGRLGWLVHNALSFELMNSPKPYKDEG
jgi:hypothetical protein